MSVTFLAMPSANPPVGWEESGAMSLGEALLLFGGSVLAITVVIVGLVLAPAAIRGSRQQSGLMYTSEPQWFSGAAPTAGSRRAIEAPASGEGRPGGGASARW